MNTPYYGYGGMTKDPNQGSANQTSGIGSRWINPEFGQAIGKYSNAPVKDSETILSSNPESPANTSEIGALQRVDTMVRIVESPNNLAKAGRLPNQKLSRDMLNKNLMILNAQREYILAQKRGDDKEMRRLLNKGSSIQSM